jgi:DNA repair protein RecO (recombination protein O)
VPTRKLYATDVLVLSHFDLGEADRVLSVLTPAEGKLKVIAKGVRRPTSRLGGSLEPFAELRLSLARGRTFDVVTQAAIIHPWLRLRDSLASTATAWYVTELADRSLEERHPAEPLYALLHRAYSLLDAGMAPGRVARWFEFRLADELGVRPEVDRCVECDRLIEPTEEVRWVPALGGVLCSRHGGPTMHEAGLTIDALRVLKAYQRMDAEAIAGLRLPPTIEREAEEAIRAFLVYTLDREPRSRRFLDEVRPARDGPPAAEVRPARDGPPAAKAEPEPGTTAPGPPSGSPPSPDPSPATTSEGPDR